MSNDINDLFAQLQTTTATDNPLENLVRTPNKLVTTEAVRSDINKIFIDKKPIPEIAEFLLQAIALVCEDSMLYTQNIAYLQGEKVEIQNIIDVVTPYFQPYIALVKEIAEKGQTQERKAKLLEYNNIFSKYDEKLSKYKLGGWIASELERLEKE